MIIRKIFYYDGKAVIDQGIDGFNWFVETIKNIQIDGENRINVIAEDLTHATAANRYFTFKCGDSPRIQISPSNNILRFATLKASAPNAAYLAGNNTTNNNATLPRNNDPLSVTVIASDYSFILICGTVWVIYGYSAKHFSNDSRVVVVNNRLPFFDDEIVTDTFDGTKMDTSSAVQLPTPISAWMPDMDTLSCMPVSTVLTTAPNFGFHGYFSEGRLRSTNRNGYVTRSLVSVNGARYIVSGNHIYRVDD